MLHLPANPTDIHHHPRYLSRLHPLLAPRTPVSPIGKPIYRISNQRNQFIRVFLLLIYVKL